MQWQSLGVLRYAQSIIMLYGNSNHWPFYTYLLLVLESKLVHITGCCFGGLKNIHFGRIFPRTFVITHHECVCVQGDGGGGGGDVQGHV